MCAVPYMAVFCSSLTSWFSGEVFQSLHLLLLSIIIIIIIIVIIIINLTASGLLTGGNGYYVYTST
jgi:hypothetical protein